MAGDAQIENENSIENELPPWLNPFQLVAWVRYRDPCTAEEADTHTNLAAKTFFPTGDIVGSAEEALEALQAGQLRSYGAESHSKMTEIEAVEWTRIALAPLDPSRQHPYEEIRFKREDVVASFPPLGFEGRESAAPQEGDGWNDGRSSREMNPRTATLGGQLSANLQPVAAYSPDRRPVETAQVADLGIAVAGAIRLNDCYHKLADEFASRPALEGDEEGRRFRFATDNSPEAQEWLHKGRSASLAESYLNRAIMEGRLSLWVRLADGDHRIDRYAIKEVNHRTVAAGAYLPFNDHSNNLVARPLWIKEADWEAFQREILTSRYGESAHLASAGESEGGRPSEHDWNGMGATKPVAPSQANDQFEKPKAEWLELWQGPLHFRATFDKGKFGPGHSLERINQYGTEGATGGGRHAPIYNVRMDPDDGAIVIEWLIGLPGQSPPFQTSRYYHGALGRAGYERVRDDPTARDSTFRHLPADQRDRAVGAYACAITIREWAEREFFHAIHAGYCEIWARVGSQVAPFRFIPADVFKAYEIDSWGYGVPGGARASLDGADTLYSIRVSAPLLEAPQEQSERKPARARKGRAKGTGYQRADAPLLVKMREAIETNPALNPTSAAKMVADEAEGASFEAKVDRLSRAYRAGRNGE